jgi:DNA-binding transcriptional MerR regulator
MNQTEVRSEESTYRIGAVSRLTGVAPDTLRVWERRYGAVVPRRTEKGSRLYSQEDIGRLSLIKRLVDNGDAISRVANLGKEELTKRLQGAPIPDNPTEHRGPCRVGVLGDVLAEKIGRQGTNSEQLEIVGAYTSREELLAAAPDSGIDVLVLEFATIQPEQVREIGTILLRSGAARAVVIYGFASRATLDRLESARIIPIRGPIDEVELRRWCLVLNARPALAAGIGNDAGIDISGTLPEKRFDAASLARIASASVTVRCECPHHLVDLISRLNAFEAYSGECEVLDVDDAALHALLHSATAQARALLERALVHVMDADAIEIEDEQ